MDTQCVKDFLVHNIYIGDEVVYMYDVNGRSQLRRGTVTKFTPACVYVDDRVRTKAKRCVVIKTDFIRENEEIASLKIALKRAYDQWEKAVDIKSAALDLVAKQSGVWLYTPKSDCYAIGYFKPNGEWFEADNCETQKQAIEICHYLNGGS